MAFKNIEKLNNSHSEFATARTAFKKGHDTFSKLFGEIAVNEWIDAAICWTEPLRNGLEDHEDFLLIPFELRTEEDSHANGVEGQPGAGEEGSHHHQHTDYTDLGPLDVSLGFSASDALDVALPHLESNERIESTDERQRHEVADDEHSTQEETALQVLAGKARITNGQWQLVLVMWVRHLAVVQSPW